MFIPGKKNEKENNCSSGMHADLFYSGELVKNSESKWIKKKQQ